MLQLLKYIWLELILYIVIYQNSAVSPRKGVLPIRYWAISCTNDYKDQHSYELSASMCQAYHEYRSSLKISLFADHLNFEVQMAKLGMSHI